MTKKHILIAMNLLLASSLALVACSGQQTTPAPATLDPQVFYTQAALTVQAGAEQTRAAMPATVTPAEVQPPAGDPPPADAPAVDPDTAAALTATASAVLLPGAGDAQAATATPLVIPSATPAVVVNPPAGNTGDKCQWVSNIPADNSKIHKNNTFNTYIKIMNSGTTTWDTKYALRYFAGERMRAPSDYYVLREVKPNDMYEFVFELVAPDSIGMKELLLAFQNPAGQTMCWINLPLEIVE